MATRRPAPASTPLSVVEDTPAVEEPAPVAETPVAENTNDDPFADLEDAEIAVVRGRVDVTQDTPEFVKRNVQKSMDGFQYITDKEGNILPEKVGKAVWCTLRFKTTEQGDQFVKLARRYLKAQEWKMATGYADGEEKKVLRYSVKPTPTRAREDWSKQRAEKAAAAEKGVSEQGSETPAGDGGEQSA